MKKYYIEGLVSIVVAVYNVAPYLKRAIDSALYQDYKEIELILVDDGSTDGSGSICDQALKKDFRVRVIHQINRGPGAARNAGLRIARGEYLAFLDGDDWMELSMISGMLCALKRSGADIAVCDYYVVTPNNRYRYHKIKKMEFLSQSEAIEEIVKNAKICSFSWDKIFKRSIFYDLSYPEGTYYEDVSTIYKTILNAKKIVLCPDPLYNYYQREDSITHFLENNFDDNLKKDYDFFMATSERQNALEYAYPKLLPVMINQVEALALKCYNEAIIFPKIENKIRKKYKKDCILYIKKNYFNILKNSFRSIRHKVRISLLLLFPSLYKLTLKILYKKRGNLS